MSTPTFRRVPPDILRIKTIEDGGQVDGLAVLEWLMRSFRPHWLHYSLTEQSAGAVTSQSFISRPG
jgi:hypothetical protein